MNTKAILILSVSVLLFSQILSAQDADRSQREKRDRLWIAPQEAKKNLGYTNKSAHFTEAVRDAGERSRLASEDREITGINPGLLSRLGFSGANREPECNVPSKFLEPWKVDDYGN